MNARFLLPYCLQLVESSNLEGTCGEEHCDIDMISAKGAEEPTIYDDDQCNGCENASRTVRGIIIIHFLLCALQCLWVRQGMGHNFPMGHNISINNKRFIRGKIFFMNSRCSNAIERSPRNLALWSDSTIMLWASVWHANSFMCDPFTHLICG